MTPKKQIKGSRFHHKLLIASGLGVALAGIAWRGFTTDASTPVISKGSPLHAPPANQADAIERAAPAPELTPVTQAPLPVSAADAQTSAPLRLPELENPILAATRTQRFSEPAAELAFWTERVRGELLTLRGRQQSLANAERVLTRSDLTDSQVRGLQQRKELLKAKVDQQARQVDEIQGRISELRKKGANDGT